MSLPHLSLSSLRIYLAHYQMLLLFLHHVGLGNFALMTLGDLYPEQHFNIMIFRPKIGYITSFKIPAILKSSAVAVEVAAAVGGA